jgi:hypothetical protein
VKFNSVVSKEHAAVLPLITPCGGGLEYLHRSPASCKRRQKGNPLPGSITGLLCSWGSLRWDSYGSCATKTSEWFANYRPVLSSEEASNCQIKETLKSFNWPWRGARNQDELAELRLRLTNKKHPVKLTNKSAIPYARNVNFRIKMLYRPMQNYKKDKTVQNMRKCMRCHANFRFHDDVALETPLYSANTLKIKNVPIFSH